MFVFKVSPYVFTRDGRLDASHPHPVRIEAASFSEAGEMLIGEPLRSVGPRTSLLAAFTELATIPSRLSGICIVVSTVRPAAPDPPTRQTAAVCGGLEQRILVKMHRALAHMEYTEAVSRRASPAKGRGRRPRRPTGSEHQSGSAVATRSCILV